MIQRLSETESYRPSLPKTERCKRCDHSNHYAGKILGGLCGSCADDLRDEAQAAEMADLQPYADEVS